MKIAVEPVMLRFEPMALPESELRSALASTWGRPSGWLLGHAFDGVLWGKLQGEVIEVAHDHGLVGAALDSDTLLDLRVFSQDAELRVWRAEAGLQACRVTEGSGAGETRGFDAWVDLSYDLLGSGHGRPVNGITQRLGRGGQRHAPPSMADRLRARHYFDRDATTGLLRQAAHRLLGLTAEGS